MASISIKIVKAVGEGSTLLLAFDKAIQNADFYSSSLILQNSRLIKLFS